VVKQLNSIFDPKSQILFNKCIVIVTVEELLKSANYHGNNY